MASLPSDRTKLALAQSNQNPLNVLGSSQNKNALTEAYDTIDLLNQKVDTNYGTGAIGTNQLADNAVTLAKMADSSVGTTELVAASVTLPKMASASVGTSQIVDGSVTSAKIANSSVGSSQLDPILLTNFGDIAVQAEFDRRGIDVMKYGAKGDGVTDDTTAILAAIATNKNLFFPVGTYLISSTISLTSANTSGVKWIGAGSTKTILKFTSAVTGYLIKRDLQQSANFEMNGIGIQGAGQTSGTNIVGFYSRNAEYSLSYNLKMIDVCVTDVSGSGFVVTDWFQQYWMGCYARQIGGNGFEISGDQFTTFIDSGNFNNNITGYSWWFRSGKPNLIELNTGMCGNGLMLGQASTDPYGGTKYCFPNIFGMNIEGINVNNGIGIYMNAGSCFGYASGINIYAENATVLYGVYASNLGSVGIICGSINYTVVGTGSFTNQFYINAAGVECGIISFGGTFTPTGATAAAIARWVSLNMDNGGLRFSNVVQTTGGLSMASKVSKTKYRTITVSENIRRDTGTQNDYIFLVDATAGVVNLSFDYGSYLPNRTYIIKKIDSSANAVNVKALGNVDGAVGGYALTAQYQTVTIWSSGVGNDWLILSK